MERNDFIAVMGIVGAVVFVYSLIRGSPFLSSVGAGIFMGLLVALLIKLGEEKIRQ